MKPEDILKVAEVFLPSRIVVSLESTILSKLWAGFISSAWLMFGGFLILMGWGNMYVEKIGPVTISNSSLLFILGTITLWFTISRVGINKKV
jgi:hypothetical protein